MLLIFLKQHLKLEAQVTFNTFTVVLFAIKRGRNNNYLASSREARLVTGENGDRKVNQICQVIIVNENTFSSFIITTLSEYARASALELCFLSS